MLKWYISSCIVWFIVNYGVCKVLEKTIVKNGWMSAKTHNVIVSKVGAYFMVSCVPILRAFFCVFFIMMSMYKYEDFAQKLNDFEKDENNT